MYTVDRRRRAIRSSVGFDRDPERRRGDVHADANAAVAALDQRKGVVDLGGRGVVDAEGGRLRARQIGGSVGSGASSHPLPCGKVLEQEAADMVLRARRQRAAALEQLRRRELERRTRSLQRLRLDRVAIGLVQQPSAHRLEFRRQTAGRQLVDVALLLFGLRVLALDRGQRSLERLVGRRLVAALAAPIEIHRRRVQLEQQSGGLHALGRWPK